MATIVKNEKGFKIIEIPRAEMVAVFGMMSVCDYCNGTPMIGFMICVLNQWYCPSCYEEWNQRATRYEEDIRIEERNYQNYVQIFRAE